MKMLTKQVETTENMYNIFMQTFDITRFQYSAAHNENISQHDILFTFQNNVQAIISYKTAVRFLSPCFQTHRTPTVRGAL